MDRTFRLPPVECSKPKLTAVKQRGLILYSSKTQRSNKNRTVAVGTFKKNCFVHCVGLSSTETDPETDHELLLFLVHTQLVGQKAQHWSEQTCRQDIFFFLMWDRKRRSITTTLHAVMVLPKSISNRTRGM